MEIIKLILFTLIMSFGIGSVRAACVVQAEDPMIQQFFRAKGIEVDSDVGDVHVEFEVTCEAIDKKVEKFSSSEIRRTAIKLEVFNQYENQKVVYHTNTIEKKSGRVESSLIVPCEDTRKSKLKLLEEAVIAVNNINCAEEE